MLSGSNFGLAFFILISIMGLEAFLSTSDYLQTNGRRVVGIAAQRTGLISQELKDNSGPQNIRRY